MSKYNNKPEKKAEPKNTYPRYPAPAASYGTGQGFFYSSNVTITWSATTTTSVNYTLSRGTGDR